MLFTLNQFVRHARAGMLYALERGVTYLEARQHFEAEEAAQKRKLEEEAEAGRKPKTPRKEEKDQKKEEKEEKI